MSRDNNSYQSLINQLSIDDRLTELEKVCCPSSNVYIRWKRLYDEHINSYPIKCSRKDSENF